MGIKSILGVALCASVLTVSTSSYSTIAVYTDEALWLAAAGSTEGLVTNSSNLALADEVATPPLENEALNSILTFQSANTGLSQGFLLQSLEPDSGFTFDDAEGVGNPSFDNALSVGDIDDFENDDWRFLLLDDGTINAFSFNLHDNTIASNETISIADDNNIFDSINLSAHIGSANIQFFGIISTVAFDQVIFNEDSLEDDIAISNFQFSTAVVPVPAAAWLFGSGLLGLVGVARRKQT